ncbi:MAG: DUF5916 domain-containing protein, partial [Bacteroidota bacterium]
MYHEQNIDFGGVRTSVSTDFNFGMQFHNFWRFESGFNIQGISISNADLRGGPSITYPGGKEWWYWFGTNNQKAVRLTFNNWYFWGDDDYARSTGVNMNIILRPVDALRLTISPSASWRDNGLQYVNNNNEDDGVYLLGRVKQATYRISFRANYNITPNLTIEYWGQPFVASGVYEDYKRVTESNAKKLDDRFLSIRPHWIEEVDDTFEV